MSKWKVYEVDSRTTASGKELKKLVLQGEGKQYPDKNVTMWSDHPLFSSIEAGQEIEAELKVEDSQTPNPKGGFYKNKTLLKPGQVNNPPPAAPQSSEIASRAINLITFEIVPRLDKILAWQDRRDVLDGIEAPKKEVKKEEGWDGVMPFEDDGTAVSPF